MDKISQRQKRQERVLSALGVAIDRVNILAITPALGIVFDPHRDVSEVLTAPQAQTRSAARTIKESSALYLHLAYLESGLPHLQWEFSGATR